MKLLFIPSIINEDWSRLKMLLFVLVVLYACVFAAVLIDLFFGIRRAKRLKISRTSYGFRRTIAKLTNYFGLLLMFTIIDILASIMFKMPYFTIIGAIGIVTVEAKSVFENLKKQEKGIEEIQKLIQMIFENKEEIKSFITFLKINSNETERTEK